MFDNKELTNILVPTLLFIILSPGLLLTIPPQDKGLFMSGQTSVTSILVHAVVFAILFYALRTFFSQYY
jgi:hypothetical protein